LNPANPSNAESTLRDLQQAAPAIGLQIYVLNASTISEIDAAFALLARERPDALFVAPDVFFDSRREQFVALAARQKLPASYANRDLPAAGGLMSYGTDFAETFRQVGVYTGSVLKGTKPSDLPVQQAVHGECAAARPNTAYRRVDDVIVAHTISSGIALKNETIRRCHVRF
jgi:putative tryptophan/tyrosine transport system substrate-binding protein